MEHILISKPALQPLALVVYCSFVKVFNYWMSNPTYLSNLFAVLVLRCTYMMLSLPLPRDCDQSIAYTLDAYHLLFHMQLFYCVSVSDKYCYSSLQGGPFFLFQICFLFLLHEICASLLLWSCFVFAVAFSSSNCSFEDMTVRVVVVGWFALLLSVVRK